MSGFIEHNKYAFLSNLHLKYTPLAILKTFFFLVIMQGMLCFTKLVFKKKKIHLKIKPVLQQIKC